MKRTVTCEGRVDFKEWKATRRNLAGVDNLMRKRVLEAAEGKPIVRYYVPDGMMLTRCAKSDEYRFFIECQEDG